MQKEATGSVASLFIHIYKIISFLLLYAFYKYVIINTSSIRKTIKKETALATIID